MVLSYRRLQAEITQRDKPVELSQPFAAQVAALPSLGLHRRREKLIRLVEAGKLASLINNGDKIDPKVAFHLLLLTLLGQIDRKFVDAARTPCTTGGIKMGSKLGSILRETFLSAARQLFVYRTRGTTNKDIGSHGYCVGFRPDQFLVSLVENHNVALAPE